MKIIEISKHPKFVMVLHHFSFVLLDYVICRPIRSMQIAVLGRSLNYIISRSLSYYSSDFSLDQSIIKQSSSSDVRTHFY